MELERGRVRHAANKEAYKEAYTFFDDDLRSVEIEWDGQLQRVAVEAFAMRTGETMIALRVNLAGIGPLVCAAQGGNPKARGQTVLYLAMLGM